MMGARRFAGHWRLIIAYAIIVAAIILVVVRQQNQSDAQDAEKNDRLNFQQAQIDENARQVDRICEAVADTRQATIDAVDTLGADLPIDPTLPPSTQERIRQSNTLKEGARQIVAQFLDPPACNDGRKPVSHTTTTTTVGG